MKKLHLLLIPMICLASLVQAQKATVNIDLKNSAEGECYLWISGQGLFYDYLHLSNFDFSLNKGKGSVKIDLTHPVFAHLLLHDSKLDKRIDYNLYLSKGDDLTINADAATGDIAVSGAGSNNNQPLLGSIIEPNTEKLYGDTLPNRIIALANNYQQQLQTAYAAYIKIFKTSPDFIRDETEDIKYSTLATYYIFKENNKFQVMEKYNRNKASWQRVQDSLLRNVSINNSEALTSKNYKGFLRDFVLREKERLWTESSTHPVEFFRDYYQTDTAKGKKLFTADMQNLLSEKIVNKNFTGAVEANGYALVLDNGLGDHDPENLVAIYDRFAQKYPDNEYVALYKPAIDSIRVLEKQPLTKDMVFLPQNGTDLKTFNDVLALARGKTILVDMWGTWCGPCRNEISKNSAALKAHFKGKGLDYLYIANHDINHEEQWKKLIAYFDMKGTHILANNNLSNDIMKTVKGEGYPTYLIIKKDGTWELSKAGYPMKRDVLIKQLENALAE